MTASLFIALEHVQGFSHKCRRKCHRSITEKGTVSKAKSLFVGSLEIVAKCREFLPQKFNGARLGRYPGRAILLYVGHMSMFFCSPKEYGFSIEPLLQNNHNIFSFLKKNVQHFHFISLLDLTFHTETNDDH